MLTLKVVEFRLCTIPNPQITHFLFYSMTACTFFVNFTKSRSAMFFKKRIGARTISPKEAAPL